MPSPASTVARRACRRARLRFGCSMPCCGAARRWTMRRRQRADCRRPTPRWRAAIAGETLRRLPDLDELIDGATRQRLPDDSKARMVLRLALAQKIGLDTPDHALGRDRSARWSTAGRAGWSMACSARCFARACRRSTRRACRKRSSERWSAAWGDEVVAAARRAIAHRPPLDLSFASDEACAAYSGRHFARAAPSAARSRAVRSTELAGLRTRAAGGSRILPPRFPRGWSRPAPGVCSTPAPRRAARRCSLPRPATM